MFNDDGSLAELKVRVQYCVLLVTMVTRGLR